LRVFLDTNVLASALMGHGLCRDLLDRVLVGQEILLGAPVREELRRILISKFRVPANLWRELDMKLDEFEQALSANVAIAAVVSDPDDVPVLACAIASRADVFVTGDKALLDLGELEGMSILSLRDLWQKLAGLGAEGKPK
jgi:uncharacterized protein